MNYIEQNLQSGEEIKYVAKLYVFLFLQPLVLLLLGWWLYGSQTAVLHYGGIFNSGTITVTTGGVTSSQPFIANPLASRRNYYTDWLD